MNQQELIDDVLDGQVHRFAELVERYDHRVREIIARQVATQSAREELVQETFYRAFRSLGSLQDAYRFEAWLAMIARRCVTDHFRQESRRREQDASERLAEYADESARPWIWDEIATLSDPLSEVLRLRYQMEMSYDEIASELNLPVSTVRGRIYEARRALRKRLESGGE